MISRVVDLNLGALLVALTIITLGVVRPYAMQGREAERENAGFEEALITRNTSRATGKGALRFQPKGGLHATSVTLLELIRLAYQRHFFDEREVVGGPAWVTSERFDLLVRVPGEHVFDSDGVPGKRWAC